MNTKRKGARQRKYKQLIIVEIQHETEYDYLQRILFGVSKLLVENMKKNMPYAKIKKIISVSIVYFDLGQGEDYAYVGQTQFIGLNKKDVLKLNRTQQEIYQTDKIADIYPEYYILKVNQFDDVTRNAIDEWIYFFKSGRNRKKSFREGNSIEFISEITGLSKEEIEKL